MAYVVVGNVYNSKKSGQFTILKKNTKKVLVRFNQTGYTKVVHYNSVYKGEIKDPYYPTLYGVGFLGEGIYSTKNKKLYKLWKNMIERCYCDKRNKAYEDCSVVKRWHNFQLFCEDIIKMKNWNKRGYALDKDLRVLKNKKYGPRYCSFLPYEVNNVFRSNRWKDRKLPEGVHLNKGSYVARFSLNGSFVYLGRFKSIEKAQKVVAKAKSKTMRAFAVKYKK